MTQLSLFDLSMRWNSRRASYRPSQEPIDPSQFSVEPIGDAAAREFVIKHHYSGSYPAAIAAYGLLERIAPFQQDLVGVAVFSVPMQPKAAAAYGAAPDAKFCELGRFVLKDHVGGNGETWLLSRALRLLAQDKQRPDRRPLYDLCLSYSDPVPRTTADGNLLHVGHVGRIYQAFGNSIYLGRGTARIHWLTRDGSIVSPRALSKLRNGERGAAYAYDFLRTHGAPAIAPGEKEADYIRRALQEGPFRRMRHNGNHAYVFPCGTHSTRQEIRRRMDKGLPRPTKTDLPMAA
jgi:hypothetical protein